MLIDHLSIALSIALNWISLLGTGCYSDLRAACVISYTHWLAGRKHYTGDTMAGAMHGVEQKSSAMCRQ